MSEAIRRRIICRGFCSFYKPRRNNSFRCAAYDFLAENLSTEELRLAALDAIRRSDYTRDRDIRSIVCKRCAFLSDGCDFRRGRRSPPCGGYAIVEWLFKRQHY
jgi:hypothetical protein